MARPNSTSDLEQLPCTKSNASPRRLSRGDGQLLETMKGRLLPLTSREALVSVAERILPHTPQCITMYNNLMQHGRGHASHATFYTLRDCADSHVVLWEWTYGSASQHMGVFCLQEEVEQAIEALAEAPFIGWNDSLVIRHIPPYLLSLLQRLAGEKGVKMKEVQYNAFTYNPHLDTEPLRLGPGLRLCRLGTAGIRRVLETTYLGRDMPVAVMRGLAQGVPYLGVYRDASVTHSTAVDVSSLSVAGEEEEPVAWGISGFFGDVSKVETVPECRRQGLGAIVGTAVARRQAVHLGFIPHGLVITGNIASQALVRGNPGIRHTHDVYYLFGGGKNQIGREGDSVTRRDR